MTARRGQAQGAIIVTLPGKDLLAFGLADGVVAS